MTKGRRQKGTDLNIHTHTHGKANQMQVKYMIVVTGGCKRTKTGRAKTRQGENPHNERGNHKNLKGNNGGNKSRNINCQLTHLHQNHNSMFLARFQKLYDSLSL